MFLRCAVTPNRRTLMINRAVATRDLADIITEARGRERRSTADGRRQGRAGTACQHEITAEDAGPGVLRSC